jgi:hypothetical protein
VETGIRISKASIDPVSRLLALRLSGKPTLLTTVIAAELLQHIRSKSSCAIEDRVDQLAFETQADWKAAGFNLRISERSAFNKNGQPLFALKGWIREFQTAIGV